MILKIKVISLPYILQVLYVLCFIRPTYQVSIYRTIGPLVSLLKHISNLNALHLWYNFQPKKERVVFFLFFFFILSYMCVLFKLSCNLQASKTRYVVVILKV